MATEMSAERVLEADVAVIGAGNVGIAVAYYLVGRHGVPDVILIDARDPMSLTSAQSGENYRNWWPHPVMTGSPTTASVSWRRSRPLPAIAST
jgi:glycine/D-amino acid oxidase-like deaminating enzyme